ncbi:cupin domain-containing protein [Franzmannia qiaohouensis]|uniref:Cupin domain-containing protein n=1 Tax=Franzmannia qiaohouensis TaxID=1329370 RepID=A0ABU1HJU3_9GAMM|nr:cupin domain-containing protein [Halomonas qiaohouensis]MDR5907764.1 cupin domain-containing protein [Halomonas qiaohouensis]
MTDLSSTAPHIHGATDYDDLVEWGLQPDGVKGESRSKGRLLYKGADNSPETGLWVCTPGRWRLAIPRDEFCHFVAGRVTYHGDNGETLEIHPGTCVLFPAGWEGEAEVHETIRNVYMLS